MLTKEDLQLLSDLMDQKLDPIKKDIEELKYNMEIVKTSSNALCEWAEAASKYYTPKIHFPLNEDEKIS